MSIPRWIEVSSELVGSRYKKLTTVGMHKVIYVQFNKSGGICYLTVGGEHWEEVVGEWPVEQEVLALGEYNKIKENIEER